jgi:phosphosulfolactate synthase
MNDTALRLPDRTTKPRHRGITMVIDGGLPLRSLRDLVDAAADYVDFVKFGWGTAVVSRQLETKIDLLRESGIDYYFGGTLFEKHVFQGRFDDFRWFCERWRCRFVEVSNGTICLSNQQKCGYVEKLRTDFDVISEVGFKDPARSERFAPSSWFEAISEDLDAGAHLVTLESRESGRSGICRPDGELRVGLVEDLVSGMIDVDRLLFEAPTTSLQAHMVTRAGPNVNLGNIPASGVLALETLRLGLRADTLTIFEEIDR